MTVLTKKNKYQADISTLAAGTELIAHPCVVWEITIVSDAAGDANVNFSDTISAYATASRVIKAKTTDEAHTIQLVYPEGKKFSNGVCATSNKASVDIAITYE